MKTTEALELINGVDEAYKCFYCLVYHRDTLKKIIKTIEREIDELEEWKNDKDIGLTKKQSLELKLWKERIERIKKHYSRLCKDDEEETQP